MGYRIFRDSRGTEWQTWDVVPRLGERRATERRSRVPRPVATDRRSGERRSMSIPRPMLRSGLDAGWLCFETADEQRRLAPIPNDWLRCAEERLEQYCAQAKAARRPSIELPAIGRPL